MTSIAKMMPYLDPTMIKTQLKIAMNVMKYAKAENLLMMPKYTQEIPQYINDTKSYLYAT